MAAALIRLDCSAWGQIDGQIRSKLPSPSRTAVRCILPQRRGLSASGGSRAVVVGGGRGLLPAGLATLGPNVVAVGPPRHRDRDGARAGGASTGSATAHRARGQLGPS